MQYFTEGYGSNLHQTSYSKEVVIEFDSLGEPVYELEQLIAICSSYPLLVITYDYAEREMGICARWKLHQGFVKRASPSELEMAKREPAFHKLIRTSGPTVNDENVPLCTTGVSQTINERLRRH